MTDPVPVADLVDQNCHGVLRTELGLGTFEARLTAADGAPPASGTTFFDSQTGFAVRRWCPPPLGLEAHCPPAHYLARRRELGVAETSRRLLRASGVSAHLVDTGPAGDLTGPAELASAAGSQGREIVRLEVLAEQVADTSGTVDAFLVNLGEAVHTAASSAVAFTSGGTDAPFAAPEPPGPVRVRAAAGRWLAGREEERRDARRGAGDRDRRPVSAEPELLDHLRWSAVACGLPLQLRLGAADPARLADFAAATEGHGCALVLLHGYPYHRQAAALAGRHPHVYADLGAVAARTGARAAGVLAEIMELAPFGKLLFSSGAQGLPELHLVGARQFREALGRVLGDWVADGAWTREDAARVATMIGSGNARRVYGLE
ncbi:amidohydrolase family protein [Streptomyces sp. NRRL_ISP-5395]|uniref:amidohydrolase family protein n=1 Tax=Streptomyces TaxID=1883 RepID=UPI0018756798|nr:MULTISPECIES: amidohydrolase family protein [Streptomyces]MDX2668660.1 amidohydrolase family protein [Streptomyces sp. NRRL_ISP-5395]GHF39500.1 amidohydrolase [Streptomyces griseus]